MLLRPKHHLRFVGTHYHYFVKGARGTWDSLCKKEQLLKLGKGRSRHEIQDVALCYACDMRERKTHGPAKED